VKNKLKEKGKYIMVERKGMGIWDLDGKERKKRENHDSYREE